MDDLTIKVQGLADLRRAVKIVDPAGVKAISQVQREAAQIVASEAGRLAPRGTTPIYPSRTFKTRLAESYTAGVSGTRAVVRSRHPAAAIKEFRKTGTPAQMRQVRPVQRAIEQEEEAIALRLSKGFDELIRHSGWS